MQWFEGLGELSGFSPSGHRWPWGARPPRGCFGSGDFAIKIVSWSTTVLADTEGGLPCMTIISSWGFM